MKKFILVVFLVALASSCGKVKSDSTHAEVIPAPISGYTCFVIKSETGSSIGGNCVKD